MIFLNNPDLIVDLQARWQRNTPRRDPPVRAEGGNWQRRRRWTGRNTAGGGDISAASWLVGGGARGGRPPPSRPFHFPCQGAAQYFLRSKATQKHPPAESANLCTFWYF